MSFLSVRHAGALLLVLAAACAEQASTSGGGDGAGAAPTSSTGQGGAASSSAQSSSSGFMSSSTGAGGAAPSILYVHSNTTLYEADPSEMPLTLATLGDFDCIGGPGESTSMTDIAVNAEGEVWAISTTRVYRLDLSGSGVVCAEIIELDNPQGISFYGMTFAPKGVLSPTEEVLIAGNSAGELWSIDAGGNLARRGTLGVVPADDGHGHAYDNAGQPWELSGDIAFFENNGSPIGFATVRDCPDPPSTNGCNEIDTLVELDVPALATSTTQSVLKNVRGQVVRASDCSDSEPGYGSVYGIGAWLGTVYGFSRRDGNGYAIAIDNVDGTACLLEAFPGSPWAGAGNTTIADVIAPPQ